MAKKSKLGVASAIVVGAGAAALYAKKASENKQAKNRQTGKRADETQERNEYRNTERGKYEKNSKGIYYSNGNYEAFARPEKPEGVDDKHAYLVGSGLAYIT